MRCLCFGPYRLDLAAGRLTRRGLRIPLREKSLQVLACLLEQPGEPVGREELRRRLWPDGVFVDYDHNLNVAVARLREALNDKAERPRWIETLARRGYRFIGEAVSEEAAGDSSPMERVRLIVLPLANLTGDAGLDYLANALSEDLAAELAPQDPDRLAVLAHTTALRCVATGKDLARIGRELRVDFTVEGSLRLGSAGLVLKVGVVRMADQSRVWGKQYEAVPEDLPQALRSAGRLIAAALGAGVARKAPPPRPSHPEAYSLYLQGRFHMHQWTPHAITRASELLGQAVSLDPTLAPAFDALGEIAWYTGFFGVRPPREAFASGVYAVLRALECDNARGETHALLGMYRKELDYNWAEVGREMRLALELAPESPVVRFRNALSGLMPHGRMEEAIAEIQLALESDPLSVVMRSWLVLFCGFSKRIDLGMEQIRAILELDPLAFLGHLAAGHFYRDIGRLTESEESFRRVEEISANPLFVAGWLGMVRAMLGQHAAAREALQNLQTLAAQTYVPPSHIAWIHFGLGELDQAFAWLDRAIEMRDPMVIPLKVYPFLEPLHQDPRYLGLLKRLNLVH